MAEELMLKVEDVYKRYRLGTIGGGTLTADLQSWWARVRHKEDPNSKIGAKTYGKNEVFYALNGISFEVRKGEALGIIGGNGAGKSTTLKLISQVTAPTEGKIYLNGRITSMLEVGTGFHPELTGRENIYLNGAILGMTKAEIDKKIEEIIDFSECRQFIDTPVKRYSSGMYVKLAFSVAAHLDSEIMIMDEVLAVGDMAFQKKCIEKMKSVAKDEGRTILYVSHNMNTIRKLCDRCIVLDKGRVIFEGDVEGAIQTYLGANAEGNSFDIKKERDYISITENIVIKSVESLNENQRIQFGDKLRFNIKFLCKTELENLHFRFCINSPDTTPAATSLSGKIDTQKDVVISKNFEVDTSHLAPGRYVLKIIAIEPTELGSQIRHDCVNRTIKFEVYTINQLHNFIWDTKWWGYYVIPDATVMD